MEGWLIKLSQGHSDEAWDLFVERYRRLIFATIRNLATDYDDILDVFACVCEDLRKDGMATLRKYAEQKIPAGRFSTLLHAVVRNQTIDWFRHRDGRKRMSSVVAKLPHLQQRIFHYVFHESHSHLEAYELLRTRDGLDMDFRQFLQELRKIYRAISKGRKGTLMRELVGALPPPEIHDEMELDRSGHDTGEQIERALAKLAPEDRLAVQLFVIDDLSAAEVARLVGWSSAKTVYNRVSRALTAMRADFKRRGIELRDI